MLSKYVTAELLFPSYIWPQMNLPSLSKATFPSPSSNKPTLSQETMLRTSCSESVQIPPSWTHSHPGFPKHEFPKLWASSFFSFSFQPALDLVHGLWGSLLDRLGNPRTQSPEPPSASYCQCSAPLRLATKFLNDCTF